MSAESDRWARAQEVFHEALEQDAAGRDAFMAEACRGDAELLNEVRTLVEAALESEDFFDGLVDRMGELPGVSEATGEEAVPDPDLVGRRVGVWELEELIGRGGMGAVYRARRADGQYDQRVALKLLPVGAATAEAQRRFLQERELLAGLEHPGIGRLIDGGVTHDGTPYFVMELVEGLPITAFCDRNGLGVSDRLRLFQQVCDAVAFAHRNLVVHRDLKPSNILVTPEGQVKLLDFGIARLVQEDPDDVTSLLHQRMTPAYASPEQLLGRPVTTASDVYGLGVLLHELLTGLSPYRIDDEATLTIIDLVCEKPVSGPSGRLRAATTRQVDTEEVERMARARGESPAALRRRLRGDLDNIVLMALRKEPERRYASARELGEDVQRHLDGFPVRARPETLSYTASRFVARHRLGVVAAAVMVLSVGTLVVASVRFGITSARQAELIALERDRATDVSEFLKDIFEDTNPVLTEGRTVSAQVLLDRGATRLRADPDVDPVTRASLMTVLGTIYQFLGLHESGLGLLEDAARLQRTQPIVPAADLAETLYQLGRAQRDMGLTDEALSNLRRSLDIRSTLDDPQALAVTRFAVARALHQSGQIRESEAAFQEAVELFRGLELEPDEEYAFALYTWAEFLTVSGEFAQAEALYREALEVLEGLLGREHPNVTAIMLGLSAMRTAAGGDGIAEGEALIREALEIDRRLYADVDGGNHPSLAQTYLALGRHVMNHGSAAEGIGHLQEALRIYRASSRPQPDMHGVTATVLGGYLYREGRLDEAEPILREAVDVFQEAFGPGTMMEANTLVALANVLADRGRNDEARDLVEAALEAYAPYLPADHDRVTAANEVLERLGG